MSSIDRPLNRLQIVSEVATDCTAKCNMHIVPFHVSNIEL